jgi:hypothetical protein
LEECCGLFKHQLYRGDSLDDFLADMEDSMFDMKQAYEQFKAQIQVTPQMVICAKHFIAANGNFGSSTHVGSKTILDALLKSVGASMPKVISLHAHADTAGMIKEWAEAVSWTLAGAEAIWGLISANQLLSLKSNVMSAVSAPYWTTNFTGGHGSGNRFPDDIHFTIPVLVIVPYSKREGASEILDEPDLFLHNLDIQGLHEDVEESLREAVRCFRHELYLASLTMLGRASEGAWMELGLKLAGGQESKKAKNLRNFIESSHNAIAKKISKIVEFYGDKDSFEQIYDESKVKAQDLANAQVWSDAVRESRNSVHYGVKPAMPNSYEKVAALLIAAVPHLRLLYWIIAAVDRVREVPSS